MSAYSGIDDDEHKNDTGNFKAPMSAFKRKEKLFKGCATVQDAIRIGGAIELSDHENIDSTEVCCRSVSLWGRECAEWSFSRYSGVHVFSNAINRKQQVELVYNSLSQCLAPPNTTNLHAHWDIEKKHELDTIWSDCGPLMDTHDTPPKTTPLNRVRWATLGYQYNWTERSYTRSHFVPFPAGLAAMAAELAQNCSSAFSINAEAAIVNFYPEGQVMGGHQDDGEEALLSPVVSLSIGPPACFLLGGLNKDEDPTAIILRSGDVLVLGGESRLRFHGVPKVWAEQEGAPSYLHPSSVLLDSIHHSNCPLFLQDNHIRPNKYTQKFNLDSSKSTVAADMCDEVTTLACSCGAVSVIEVTRALKFLSSTRINMNLRQVFKEELQVAK